MNYFFQCMIWNVEQAEPVNVIDCQSNIIHSISWNRDGSLFCMTCKDKKLRIIDPRLGDSVGVSEGIVLTLKTTRKQTTKLRSAKFQKMFHPSYIILRSHGQEGIKVWIQMRLLIMRL